MSTILSNKMFDWTRCSTLDRVPTYKKDQQNEMGNHPQGQRMYIPRKLGASFGFDTDTIFSSDHRTRKKNCPCRCRFEGRFDRGTSGVVLFSPFIRAWGEG